MRAMNSNAWANLTHPRRLGGDGWVEALAALAEYNCTGVSQSVGEALAAVRDLSRLARIVHTREHL